MFERAANCSVAEPGARPAAIRMGAFQIQPSRTG